jgi:MFS family permease
LTSKQSPEDDLHNEELSRRNWQGIFDALKNIAFRKYWLGLFVLNFGGQLQGPAQAWLAYQLTGSPLKLTLVMAMQSIPWFLLSMYSGVIIDRIQKRNVIVICQIISTIVAGVVATLIATGNIQYWHLLVSSFISGINGAFNTTARNSIIAELVPREKLYNAIALNNVGTCAASILGPAICGILIGTIGTQGAYYAGIGLYVVGIIIMAMLPATGTLAKVHTGSMVKNLVEGLSYLRKQRRVVILLGMELALTLFGVVYSGLIPVFAGLWNLKSEGYGFLLAASGIGSMLGSLVVASLGNYKKKGLLILIAGIVSGLVVVLFANTRYLSTFLHIGSLTFYLACFFLIAVGLAITIYSTTSNTNIQMNSTDEFRGRVNGVYSMIVALYPLATLGLGAMAEVIGAPLALSISAGILTLFMAGVLMISRSIREME